MSLMFPPHSPLASTAKPLTVMRRFRVELQCSECRAQGPIMVEMLSEPENAGSTNDFYGCGAHHLIDNTCHNCGADGLVILDAAYVRSPNEPALALPGA